MAYVLAKLIDTKPIGSQIVMSTKYNPKLLIIQLSFFPTFCPNFSGALWKTSYQYDFNLSANSRKYIIIIAMELYCLHLVANNKITNNKNQK